VVGFAAVQLDPERQGSIEGGVPHPFAGATHELEFVYNLVPRPGIPAQFSLEVEKTKNLLDTELRSNGNYGVTIGDEEAAGITGDMVFKRSA